MAGFRVRDTIAGALANELVEATDDKQCFLVRRPLVLAPFLDCDYRANAFSIAAASAASAAQATYPSGRTRTVVRRSLAQALTVSHPSRTPGPSYAPGVISTNRPPRSAS
jgi:hypothetical protein